MGVGQRRAGAKKNKHTCITNLLNHQILKNNTRNKMKPYFINSRRIFLKNSLALGTLLLFSLSKPSIGYSDCTLSPKESSGPFYPLSFPIDQDNDLTYLNNQSLIAEGEIIYIKGLVQNESCEPISNALVEIWQACSTGRYNHPDDKNPAKLDPNFQYWGKAITNKDGEYGFKTIKPGSYPVNWFWTRPPHIHFTVSSSKYSNFTTQMYFSGDPLNNKDWLLKKHTKAKQTQSTVSFNLSKKERIGIFNLTLSE